MESWACTGFGTREREEPVHQHRKAIDLSSMLPMIARYSPSSRRLAKADFSNAADGGERGSELVRHVSGEPAHLVE